MHKMDYALYLIKPDGIDAGIQNVLHRKCADKAFHIEVEESFRIRPQDISYLFNTGFLNDAYTRYLTSTEVIVGVCSGIDAFEWLASLKYEIRKECGKLEAMCNLLHTCEPGLEQMRQMNHFFPEWVNNGWGPTADMYIPIYRHSHSHKLEEIISKTNLEYVGIILTEKGNDLADIVIPGVKVFYGVQLFSRVTEHTVPLLLYFQHKSQAEEAFQFNYYDTNSIINYVNQTHGVIIAGYFQYRLFSRELLVNLTGINGIYLFDPTYAYYELNDIEHWSVVTKNMIPLGGSHGIYPIGRFGIPASYFAHVFNQMGEKK